MILLTLALIGYLLIALYVRHNIKTAYKRYKITYRNELYTVRDSKGRFVTITDNWWNLARLGL